MKRAWVIAATLVVAAPTAGDIGSCGQEIADLDPVKFYTAKETLDCSKCVECGFITEACVNACSVKLEVDAFPEGCFPLVHDGEVCLDALEAAGCDEYRPYVDDFAPTTPTECNFCPLERKPQ